jgi:hypothetical protein
MYAETDKARFPDTVMADSIDTQRLLERKHIAYKYQERILEHFNNDAGSLEIEPKKVAEIISIEAKKAPPASRIEMEKVAYTMYNF